MSLRTITRGLAIVALAFGAACATKSATSLTDGRAAIPAPPDTTPKSTPPGAHDAGIHLPPEGAAQPLPQVTSLTPSRALVDGIAPTVSIQGTNFVPRTAIQVDGVYIKSSFVSDKEMRATLDAAVLGEPGKHPIVAVTPAPGGGTSAPATFVVENPLATVTTLAPNAVLASAGDTTLTITGSNFVKTSTASINGFALATTFKSATQLTALIPSAKLVVAGAAPIVITNPAPGGGASKSLSFTVANPTVTVTAVAPTSAIVDAPAAAITVTGTGFVAASAVSFNGAPIPTAFTSATSLTATIPAASLATVGNFPVIVTNPAPGGGVSLPFTFVVGNPTPAITSITPTSGTVGDPPTTLKIDGTGFVAASQVAFDGTASATTFVSATEVDATLTAAQLATAGAISITVTNPAPGGGPSNATTFTIDNPTPTLTSIAPASVTAGAGDTPLVAYGTGFVAGSTVQADGVALATTYVSASELQATVPASSLTTATTIAITVANPDPGASTSGTQTLTVTDAATGDDDGGASCDTTGVDVVLDSTGSPTSAALSYALGPTPRYAYNPDDSTAFTCPVVYLSVSSTTYAAIVVQNTSGVAAYLEANADCAATDDAFLAAYANTADVPTASADRQACTGYVANGVSGGGGLTSANANGSDYCPGLTSANGGAVTLQPCEKVVLIVQPYDLTQFTAPATIDVQLTPP